MPKTQISFLASFFIVALFATNSCTNTPDYPSSVEQALAQAGENAPELEKVLEHYSGDSTDQW